MVEDEDVKITHRKLPHWTFNGSDYFVTSHLKSGVMSYPEKKIVFGHIMGGHKNFYILFALTVMPEHIHVILHPMEDFSLRRIMKGIKGVTANKINLERNSRGSIWMDESYDRIIRNEKEFGAIANYMLNNPVERGLIDDPWNYEFWFLMNSRMRVLMNRTYCSIFGRQYVSRWVERVIDRQECLSYGFFGELSTDRDAWLPSGRSVVRIFQRVFDSQAGLTYL